MDTLKVILIVFLTVIITVFILGQLIGVDAGAFTIVIALAILLSVFIGVAYFVMYSTHKAEDKIKALKETRKLNKKELWKDVDKLKEESKNNTIESENTIIWKDVIKFEGTPEKMKDVIKDFFVADNIDFYKYAENEKANELSKGRGLSGWEMFNRLSAEPKPDINCTPTFRKHFADDFLKRSPSVPEWFYIAYPDVEVWIHKRAKIVESEIISNPGKYLTNGMPNNNALRLIIEKYKTIVNLKLECEV
ncbi:hypothetical protein MHL31_12515 [Lutibacter sp. A80]|uniref:hypothetical protein n=1 Tax=Lutibacter sp. A80 TaxID=2918453 RepID=UPI001F06FEC6|nr:hypothetical protein [Lutibacter sp. A80]UMB59893.1 hypothetical protein MHL31_12515 [Lutibacter sp. A80]